MIKHLNIRVYGMVQGVFFRRFTFWKARELNIRGWVRNDDDNSVSIEAEGEEKNLNDFLIWCKKGPVTSEIEKVDFEFSDDLKNFPDFSIKY